VQAALQLNPSVAKQERLQNIEAAKKLFDAGNYSAQFLDEFLGVDTPHAIGVQIHKGPVSAVSNEGGQGKASMTGFFGRKKK
jgi:hypothetical protein